MKYCVALVAIVMLAALIVFPWEASVLKYSLKKSEHVELVTVFSTENGTIHAELTTKNGGWMYLSRLDHLSTSKAKSTHVALNHIGAYKIWCGYAPDQVGGGTGLFKVFEALREGGFERQSILDLLADYGRVEEFIMNAVPEPPSPPRRFVFSASYADGIAEPVWCERRKRP